MIANVMFDDPDLFSGPWVLVAACVFMVSGMGDMIVGDTFYMTGGSGTITLHG